MAHRDQILHGHTSPETAYQVDDYPYGRRLRCKIRYWIETADKGAKRGEQRFVYQTTNPRTGNTHWNKPKAGTYVLLAVMYLDENGHVQWTGVRESGISPVDHARWRLRGFLDQLDEDQQNAYETYFRVSRTYRKQWDRWDNIVQALAAHIRATGEPPTLTNGVWAKPDGATVYLGDDAPYYFATAQQLTS
jgi:hypothetical protein